MQYLYVDESGSMTKKHSDNFPFFTICTIIVRDPKKLKKHFNRFISKNYQQLKNLDDNIAERRRSSSEDKIRMFDDNNKFKELKGACLDYEMKKEFVNYFCKGDFFEIIFIRVNNKKVEERLYNNTARAFNYIYKLMLEYSLKKGLLKNEKILIQFDERNQKTECRMSLEDYLNTELYINYISDEIEVSYYDSQNNKIIQISDVLSNIFYSYCFNENTYGSLIKEMRDNNCLKYIFKFPPS